MTTTTDGAARLRGKGSGLRVLVVEDYPDCAESMALLLRRYGHTVEIAKNGPVALEAARYRPPDVVLLDIGLPGMDGWKVARRIREQASGRKQLLVAVTGFGDETDCQHSKESGIDLHLTKPVHPEELEVLLRSFQRIIAEDTVAVTFEANGRFVAAGQR